MGASKRRHTESDPRPGTGVPGLSASISDRAWRKKAASWVIILRLAACLVYFCEVTKVTGRL